MRELYPPRQPYNEGELKVSDLHTIHFEESATQRENLLYCYTGDQEVDVRLFIDNILTRKSGVW